MAKSFLSEPGYDVTRDYYNQPFSLFLHLEDKPDDASLIEKIGFLRQTKPQLLLTVEQTYFDPQSRQYSEGWMKAVRPELEQNPKRTALLNRLTGIVNTTDSLCEFKKAMNAMSRVIYRNRTNNNFFRLAYLTDRNLKIPKVTP